jgi:CRP/FNR family transcriptional regulator
LRAAIQLSSQYNNACRELRWVGLSRSADWKLASMLLTWSEEHPNGAVNGQARSFKMTLTHEEMAQMIGTTRETVTRVFARFKRQKLVEVRGATLVLRDPRALQEIASRAGSVVEMEHRPSSHSAGVPFLRDGRRIAAAAVI